MSEVAEYRKGDKVWVEGVVNYDTGLNASCVSVSVNGAACYPPLNQVVLIQQFFVKGDHCIYQDTPCTVVWIDGNGAWIKGEDGQDWVVDAMEIRRPGRDPAEPSACPEEFAKVT